MIAVVTYDPERELRENVPPERLAEVLRRKDGVVWVDLSAPTKEESGILASVFGFHPLALEDCGARRRNPRIVADGPGAILYSILDDQVDPYFPVAAAMYVYVRRGGIFRGPER